MTKPTTRTRKLEYILEIPAPYYEDRTPSNKVGTTVFSVGQGTQKTVSEGHRFDRKKGHYDSGGPFYTSRIQPFATASVVHDIVVSKGGSGKDVLYHGPILTRATGADLAVAGYSGLLGSFDEGALEDLGATAVSLCNPVNPASDLGLSLAESYREGLPSLPGIQSWKKRTEIARSLGKGLARGASSEYLNYIFAIAPLIKEVSDVVTATRKHRDIMKQYHHGEGRDTHRGFTFPLDRTTASFVLSPAYPDAVSLSSISFDSTGPSPVRTVSMVKETKAWFEGSFTYGLPSSSDSWKKHLGFGQFADQIYGLSLNPEILWELTPWSWAVDWFTNAGEVINNISNFALAGLVMRYGFMMEETIEKVTVTSNSVRLLKRANPGSLPKKYEMVDSGPTSRGFEVVTKRRVPANPFGFRVKWEGLSPTQLAITAALGITRVL